MKKKKEKEGKKTETSRPMVIYKSNSLYTAPFWVKYPWIDQV